MDGGGLAGAETLGLKGQKQDSSGLWTKCGLGRAECQLCLSALMPAGTSELQGPPVIVGRVPGPLLTDWELALCPEGLHTMCSEHQETLETASLGLPVPADMEQTDGWVSEPHPSWKRPELAGATPKTHWDVRGLFQSRHESLNRSQLLAETQVTFLPISLPALPCPASPHLPLPLGLRSAVCSSPLRAPAHRRRSAPDTRSLTAVRAKPWAGVLGPGELWTRRQVPFQAHRRFLLSS